MKTTKQVWVGWVDSQTPGTLAYVINRTPGSLYCESDRPQVAAPRYWYRACVWQKVPAW